MVDERVFFDQADTKVTSARFICDGATYAMSTISSVKVAEEESGNAAVGFGFVLSLILLGTAPLYGVAVLAAVMLFLFKRKTTYCVVLATTAGEQTALSTDNKSLAVQVVTAVNEAIVHRG